MARWLASVIAIPVLALTAGGDGQRAEPFAAAEAFLASLDRDQHRVAVFPFDDDYRTLWRYVPAERKGVAWKSLDKDQASKASALLRATLSELGANRVEDVRKVESVLAEIERNPQGRDRDNYLFTFFGTPHEAGKWGWRYEGHHVSLNFTYQGKKMVASSPQFFGSNPAEVRDGANKGMRILGKEEDLAIALLTTLTEEQRKQAVLAPKEPADIFTSQDRKAGRVDDRGLKYVDMDHHQQSALMELVRRNAEVQAPAEVKRRMEAIEKAGLDSILFAWMGAPDRSGGHYYRIQGPTFIIEFDNTQNNANHIHLVWRDFDGDFGRDVLMDHYQEHAHDPAHGHTH